MPIAESVVDDGLGVYLRQMGRIPVPSADQQIDLARRAQAGDDRARRDIVAGNLRLVVFWAQRYQRRGVDLVDLIQEGNIGLHRAVDRFNPERGIAFSTYATWWIRQSVQRVIEKQKDQIYVPSDVSQVQASLDRLSSVLPEASDERLSRITGFSQKQISFARATTRRMVSLNADIIEGESELGDLIPDDVDVESDALALLKAHNVQKAVATLEKRDQKILKFRFGLDGNTPMTLDSIAKRLSISTKLVKDSLASSMALLSESLADEAA